ncbi:MAG: transporter [Candidatus Cloacimonetes bacterium HGW-Cloacimonetes-2]|jgi:phospholipid/cholesterol/gamma-HCH transport system permease protein|nr:MAG: transporter [Candidatus Cloacimonetes bacterium HGW-Cloacimonetes-2]
MAELKLNGNNLQITGNLTAETVQEISLQARRACKTCKLSKIDLSGLQSLDSAGVALIDELQVKLGGDSSLILIEGLSDFHRAIYETFSSLKLPKRLPEAKPGLFERLGSSLVERGRSTYEVLLLSSEVFYWSIVGAFNRRAARKGSLAQQAYLLGSTAFPIIALLSFIIGFILSLQSGIQLRTFGANIFLADLLSFTMVREMGPLITAIIVAGRSGSAIASEIATMKVTEELDALRVMALNPIRYTVVPKMHAITIVMPILVMFSILFGMIGGAFIGLGYLDMSFKTFFSRSIEVIYLKDIIITFAKSTVFAWAIVIIGAFYGFQVRGGAEGVGKATTMSVVSSIFTVIVIDAIFSLLYL